MDETRSIIDRNIARLEESIRALKSRRNDLSPISRLPVEILCNIFKFSLTESWTMKPESWTNFSQVSQQWRTSALSAPELWTNIPLNYPRWAREMLIRSKMAKLTIRSSHSDEISNPKTIETVKSCLYEMIRVGEIKLTWFPGLTLAEIFWDLPKSAPQLHTLCIRPSTGTAFSIPEDFLYDTNRLQHVELTNCKISWDSPLLTGLTRLTLQASLKANSSIIQVLQALQRMPALTDLHLKDSIPDDSEGPFTYAVVDLPCLRVLNISSGVGALTAVLRHITFPHSAILNLTCKEIQFTQVDLPNFFSVLATKFLSTLVIRSLSLQASDDSQTNNLKFYLWTNALIQDCFPLSEFSQSQLQLVLKWPLLQPYDYTKALTCAFDAMNLPFLTQLQMSCMDCIDSQTWLKTLGKLPQLERVCVQSSALDSFLEALVYKTNAAKKSKTSYHNVPFPKLRYIHLEGADFFTTNPTITSVDMLLDYLMERCERNAEVQTLRLDDCSYISFDDVERLKEIVVDVIWDGVEKDFSEEDSEEDDGEGSGDLDDDDMDDDDTDGYGSDVHWAPSSFDELLW